MKEYSIPALSLDAINEALAEISVDMDKRKRGVIAEGYSAPVAGNPFIVNHSLGYVPDIVYHDVTGDMNVWATVADRKQWTETQVVLRGDVADTLVKVKLEKN